MVSTTDARKNLVRMSVASRVQVGIVMVVSIDFREGKANRARKHTKSLHDVG